MKKNNSDKFLFQSDYIVKIFSVIKIGFFTLIDRRKFMNVFRNLALIRILGFCLILLTTFRVKAQNSNAKNENTQGLTANREIGSSNSNRNDSTIINNQNTSVNKETGNSSVPSNSNQNTSGQSTNTDSSNSDKTNNGYVIEYGNFKMAGFPFWFNVVVLLILLAGFVYLTFWHIPDKFKNLSGENIMKISILGLTLLVFAMAISYGFYGQSVENNNTNTNAANQNTANTAVANNSSGNNQTKQTPANTSTNTVANNQTNQNTNTVANTATNSGNQTNNNARQIAETNSSPTETTSEPVIEDIYRLGYENDKDERNKAGIRDIIIVKVKNLKKLVDLSLCLDEKGKEKSGCTKQKISLFLEGRKIDSVEPEAVSLNGNDGTLQFHLSRSAGNNDEAWADLLGNPPIGDGFFFRKDTKVSVGLENEYAVAGAKSFNLIRIREYRFWIFTILYVFLLFLIFRLAVKSDILRDIGEQPDGSRDTKAFGLFRAFEFGTRAEVRKPYSLARFQMAFWFLLVIGSFFYIWLITGALDIITTEILGLIGIGAGTALGAAAIDVGKRETANNDLNTKQEEKKSLEEEIATLNSKINVSPPPVDLNTLESDKKTKEEKLAKLTKEMENLGKSLRASSKGFLKDVLTDATGVSFHRFQMFIWTLVLGVIFIISVWTRLSMPDFGATLLALLGISAGTYLGFKIPENQNTTE
jgi:hypothetical protein